MSDHFIVEAQTSFNPSAREESFRQPQPSDGPGGIFDRLNFLSDDANWNDLNKELNSYNWEMEIDSLDPAQMMTKFSQVCASSSQKKPGKTEKQARSHAPGGS